NYSICVRHYNQIITSNVLLEKLKVEDNSISSSPQEGQRKRSRVITIDEDAEIHNPHHTDPSLEKTKNQFNQPEDQQIKDVDIINGYQQRIHELEMQNSKLILENEELKEKWNNRFN